MKMTSLLGVWAVVGCSAIASAALIVDTGPPTNDWGQSFVGGSGQAGVISQSLAGKFTLDQTYDIYAMRGYLNVNVAGDVLISICDDINGYPGATLFNKSFASESDQYPYFYGWQGTTGYAGRLDAGTYWITFGAPDGSSFQGGMGASALSAPVMAAEAYRANMGTGLGWSDWWVAPADAGLGVYAQINGTPVPEPSTVVVLAGGLVGLAAMRRKSGRVLTRS